jgi:hypothetical protein
MKHLITAARVDSGDLAAVELSRVHAGRVVYLQAILNILDLRAGLYLPR